MPLSLDFETRSDVDLLKAGAYVYCESPHTDALLASYRIDDGPLRRWTRGEPCPADIAAHVTAGNTIHAHNAAFERLIWWRIMSARHGWPKPRLEQFRCTAVAAAAMSLPRSLDRLGAALDLPTKKDGKGRRLINAHSKPQRWEIIDGIRIPVWNDDPAGLAEFHDYCDTDVLTEESAARRLIPLSVEEQAVYALNERINDRGIRLDVRSARAAVRLIEKAKKRLDAEMRLVTDGYVPACTNVAALTKWVQDQGVELGTLGKDDIEELLDEVDDLPDRVKRALALRQEAAKTSVSKIAKMLERVSADGRIRGVYLHHGAGQTGRFSSRGVQAHNLPRYRKVFEDAHLRPDILFDAIRSEDPAVLEALYGSELGRPLHLISDAVRGFLWAAPGHDIIDADYSSIEGRMAAWFAGETWKLDAYRAIDRGEGYGMYELTAANIFGVPVAEVDKRQRQGGKVGELSLGYQGGVGALARMARANKLKLATIYGPVWEAADSERREQVEKRYEERLEKHDATAAALGRNGWIAGELIKIGWRAAHPGIVAAWDRLDNAARAAVEQPGTAVSTLGVRYLVAHGFLWCQLPSGRCLAYGAPRIEEVEAPWADKTVEKAKRETKRSVTVMGVDSQTERWVRYPIYGGSLFNNVVQGSARDVLVHGMFAAERHGYPIVLHTHDEIAAEVPHGFGSKEEFEQIINVLPAWAKGLPLTADGWRGKRYRK
jgi:DNA polymerase